MVQPNPVITRTLLYLYMVVRRFPEGLTTVRATPLLVLLTRVLQLCPILLAQGSQEGLIDFMKVGFLLGVLDQTQLLQHAQGNRIILKVLPSL